MSYESFEDLNVWKACRDFRKSVTLLTKKFPTEERFRLTDQIIRSARSVTANIAEGHGRFHYQEEIKYCRNARGSLSETLDHLIVAHDEGYITDEELKEMRKSHSLCLKLLNGYILYLKSRKSNEK